MHFRWHLPLPGPFSVGGRVDGRATGGVLVGLAKLTYYMTIWPLWMILVLTVKATVWTVRMAVLGTMLLVRYVQTRRAGTPGSRTTHRR